MSRDYAKNNDENTKNLFNKRVAYKILLFQKNYNNVVDFNFAEKFLYGRVNRFFIPIVVTNRILALKNFQKKNLQGDTRQGLNFVVDAFNALAQQFEKCSMTGQIDPNDPFLSSLRVFKAYEDPSYLYNQHIEMYFSVLSQEFQRSLIKVKNFEDFITNYFKMIAISVKRIPFTYPAFIKSRLCPITCNGVTIELADLNAANDDEKITQFLNSKNWEFFVNACNSYGFMIDLNTPWRIVADIASEAMQAYASQYGATTTDEILLLGYGYAQAGFYEKFKYQLLRLYNEVKVDKFLVTKQCGDKTISTFVEAESYTPQRLFKVFSDEYFLKIYFHLRFLEDESHFEEAAKMSLIDDCLEIYSNTGPINAINNFERILNKPFDYRGSLSYINTVAKARE